MTTFLNSSAAVSLVILTFLLALGHSRNSQNFPRRWPSSNYGRIETEPNADPELYGYYTGQDLDNRHGYESADDESAVEQPRPKWHFQHEQRRYQPDLHQVEQMSSSVSMPMKSQYVAVNDWASSEVKLGQISAVTFDNSGNLVIFQRGDHVWDATTFDGYDNYMKKEEGPISQNTIISYDADSGKVVHQWGANLFFMPHGLAVDSKGFIFLTDVALHQVFKFPPRGGDGKPLLVLGTRWANGDDKNHFCKPSAVAVTKGGDFFVADGYCNHRIVKFDKNGEFLMQFGRKTWPQMPGSHQYPPPYAFSVPHALALAEERNIICVADRENGRIQCFQINNGTYIGQIVQRDFGHRLFSIAYSPIQGGLIFAVNGPDLYDKNFPVQGFALGITSQQLVATFAPLSGTFSNPHDMAVSYDGREVYVVELDPHKVWKFVDKNGGNGTVQRVETMFEENSLREATVAGDCVEVTENSQFLPIIEESPHYLPQSVEALIVVAALVSISMVALIFILIRKRGVCCYWFRYKKWQYRRTNSDNFKLGSLLDPHSGFELVGQDMSDEEEIDDESGSDSATKLSLNDSFIANA